MLIKPPTAAAFRYWLLTARAGEEFVYYVGDLQHDRVRPAFTGSHRDPDPINRRKATGRFINNKAPKEDPEFPMLTIPEVDAVGKAAWAAWEAGDVELKQRRLGENYYEYIARRRHKIINKEIT